MILASIQDGTAVFVDANTLVYALAPDPVLGPECRLLLHRIEVHDIHAYTSAHVLSDVSHRLMAFEASNVFGWSHAGIVRKMKRHPANLQLLRLFRLAIEGVLNLGIRIVLASEQTILAAAGVTQQFGLLSNDALIVALMQEHGLTQLASHDADFDRVPGIARFAPA